LPPLAGLGLLLFLAVVSFFVFTRFSFVLAASSVDAPYSLVDSWRALSGAALKVASLYGAVMLPALLLLIGLAWFLNVNSPPLMLVEGVVSSYQMNLSYWLWAPVGLALVFFMQIYLVTAISICFYIRTGWRPGSERVDV
jgi:hypothetical protein